MKPAALTTVTLRVVVEGETVELDVPPLVVDRLHRLAAERGTSAQRLAGELIERAIAREKT